MHTVLRTFDDEFAAAFRPVPSYESAEALESDECTPRSELITNEPAGGLDLGTGGSCSPVIHSHRTHGGDLEDSECRPAHSEVLRTAEDADLDRPA